VSALFLGDWRLENGSSSHLTASEEAEGYRKWLQTGAQTKGSGMGALRWIPSTCQLPPWPQVLGETVKTLPYTTVVFLGDSTNIEFGYVVKLMLEWASGHRGTVAVTSGGGFQVKVVPSHTFNSTISYLHQHTQRMHTYYVINNGLWDLCLYGNQRVEQNVDLFFQQIRGRSDVIWRTTLELHFFPWGLIHQQLSWRPLCPYMNGERIVDYNLRTMRRARAGNHHVFDTGAISAAIGHVDGRDGTHVCSLSDVKNEIIRPSARQCTAFVHTFLTMMLLI